MAYNQTVPPHIGPIYNQTVPPHIGPIYEATPEPQPAQSTYGGGAQSSLNISNDTADLFGGDFSRFVACWRAQKVVKDCGIQKPRLLR